ncbi:MAG: phosphoribosylglycinamide formyltransferase [Spirochaetia bacterium]|nr:phosphoribosylglycinamide formyltransferase [Spirochaetia bacterium]
MPEKPNIAILISGRGSNMETIIHKVQEGFLRVNICLVFSDVPEAPGLEIARSRNIPVKTFSPKQFNSFSEYEENLVGALKQAKAGWIVCAGYMRILKKNILESFKGKIINIHPSLLPAFPGLNAQKQALNHGVKISGCTVHFVDEGVDTGPIILQTAVEVKDTDSVDDLVSRIRQAEHDTYWRAIASVVK